MDYLYNVARNFIGQLGGIDQVAPHLRGDIGAGGGALYATVSDMIQHTWGAERMGKIVSLGAGSPRNGSMGRRTTLLEIHRGDDYIDKFESGDTILIRVATTTVLAAMKDLVLYNDNKPKISGAES